MGQLLRGKEEAAMERTGDALMVWEDASLEKGIQERCDSPCCLVTDIPRSALKLPVSP